MSKYSKRNKHALKVMRFRQSNRDYRRIRKMFMEQGMTFGEFFFPTIVVDGTCLDIEKQT